MCRSITISGGRRIGTKAGNLEEVRKEKLGNRRGLRISEDEKYLGYRN